MDAKAIAHFREKDQQEQLLCDHLQNTACLAMGVAGKIGLARAGQLLGLLHDVGKYSHFFQEYIKSATGLLDPDADNGFVDVTGLKGKIDHSTAGAQWIWQQFSRYGDQGKLVGQILAVCLASHHGGMLDCLRPDGVNGFQKRINKPHERTHLQECQDRADGQVIDEIKSLVTESFLQDFLSRVVEIVAPQTNETDAIKHFRLGMLSRFLFSCLIDADRMDSADFENPANREMRPPQPVYWQIAIGRLEKRLADFTADSPVNKIRWRISEECLQKAESPKGIYTLTVPTGGGKTFASMRFALHHAHKHRLDHIFYIIPFTSIIEQNVDVMRRALESDDDPFPWILEHHSNLEPEQQTWQSKLVSENWDAPIIFTTMVQFLEVLFGGGTRGPRRLHNLANSVIIFDEIQSLPVKCVHLFCNGLQFLVAHCGSTAVLCTATQPLLDGVDPAKGCLTFSRGNELVKDVDTHFADLKRVEVKNLTRSSGWQAEEIAEFVLQKFREQGNCLVIVNTKKWARSIYELCRGEIDSDAIVHLSTSLCPAHRRKNLGRVTTRLEACKPVLCISTQLIEAGVDVDFNCVIRFLAGLASIAQAAGRCNRNGRLGTGKVFLINPQNEPIESLEDIKIGRDVALRIFSENTNQDLLHPEVMRQYFTYYFYRRADIMAYPLSEQEAGHSGDSLLNLLADNPLNIGRETDPAKAIFRLQQSFKTAGRAFAAIDAPTHPVIVQWGDGRQIVADLCASFEPSRQKHLLQKTQKFTVNLFPNTWRNLVEQQAVFPVQEGEEIFYLDERYYSDEFGVSTEKVADMDLLNV